jgi:ribosomal protein S12 methylthiotransferase accessory factor
VMGERLAHDILYSSRLGGKIFSSSGLGSGFTLAEAAVHALAELIERHAVRLAEIEIDNPGGVGLRRFEFVDLESLPATPAAIAGHYLAAGMTVRILDITSEIEVPTFYARVFDDPFRSNASMSSDGFACHPSPQVAITMALLEAAQTKAGVIAGGREDYSLQARSLGRHERPRTMVPSSQVFWFCGDRPIRAFDSTQGFDSPDILTELEWMVDRVADAGFRQCLLVDLTTDRIRPAHAVRMLVPGTETTNPLYTGLRARATLIRDFLTRPVRAASGRPR